MKKFEYVIKDKLGIHARPAGIIVKEAAKYSSSITMQKGEKSIDAKKIFALMSLGVKNEDSVTIICEGEDEEAALDSMEMLFNTNL
ncbi:MAG: HPr family phosphocarrier protein [Mobilitalea sp.]